MKSLEKFCRKINDILWMQSQLCLLGILMPLSLFHTALLTNFILSYNKSIEFVTKKTLIFFTKIYFWSASRVHNASTTFSFLLFRTALETDFLLQCSMRIAYTSNKS